MVSSECMVQQDAVSAQNGLVSFEDSYKKGAYRDYIQYIDLLLELRLCHTELASS